MADKLHTLLDRIAKERGLWQRPRAEVRDELILLYLPFAEQLGQMAAERNPNVDRDDAIQEATIGLIEAVDKFDASNGALPSTFLGWRIRGGAAEAARKNDFVSYKIRAEDKTLRARAVAGDESVRACDLLPEMTSVAFESCHKLIAAGQGLSEPENRPDLSSIEAANELVERVLAAADAVTASYVRDILAASAEVGQAGYKAVHFGGTSYRRSVKELNRVLAKKWGVTVTGAAAIHRSCLSTLQSLHLPA